MTDLIKDVVHFMRTFDPPPVTSRRNLLTERVLVMDSRFPTWEGLEYCSNAGLRVLASCHPRRRPWNRMDFLKEGLHKGEYRTMHLRDSNGVLVCCQIKKKKVMWMWATVGQMTMEDRILKKRKGETATYWARVPRLFGDYSQYSQAVDTRNKMARSYAPKRCTRSEQYAKTQLFFNLCILRALSIYNHGRSDKLSHLHFREELVNEIHSRWGDHVIEVGGYDVCKRERRKACLCCAHDQCHSRTSIYCTTHNLYVCALHTCKGIPEIHLRKWYRKN
jgi:hypothetical protein